MSSEPWQVTRVTAGGGGASRAGQIRPDAMGVLAVLLAASVWGTSGIFITFVMRELSPVLGSAQLAALSMAFWRDLCTFLVLLLGVGLLHTSWLRVERRDVKWLAAMGASLGIFHVVWNLAVFLNGAAVATVQQAAMPAIVAVAARLIWSEPLTRAKVGAIILAFSGTVLVSSPDLALAQLSAVGFLLGLGVPVLYAAWNLLGKKVRRSYNPFTVLTYAFAFASVCLLPIQFFIPQPVPVPTGAWVWFAGLVFVATIAGFTIYFYGLGRLQASVAAILSMVEIAFVALYAYWLLDERLSPGQVMGALLVAGGVLLLYLPSKKPARGLGENA